MTYADHLIEGNAQLKISAGAGQGLGGAAAWVDYPGTWTPSELERFTVLGNVMTYTGPGETVHVSVSIYPTASASDHDLQLGISVDGAAPAASARIEKVSIYASQFRNQAFTALIPLTNGQTMQFQMRDPNSGNVTITSQIGDVITVIGATDGR
jgi:hypothetical protein